MRVAYLGPAGTFSEEAARAADRAAGAELMPETTIADAIEAVALGHADEAIVPIENSIEGSVAQTLDTLADRSDVTIVAEQVLPVSHFLVAARDLAEREIERVVSHPQPLGQCAHWLRAHTPAAELVAASSTADAVREVAASDAPWAAIGTRRAAELYGGTVLAEGIEDEAGNATRFVWVAPAGADVGSPAKTSIVFWGAGDDTPGWLVRCLSEFAFRGVNLTKIESRPLRGRLGHYRFFVDLDLGLDAPDAAEAVAALRGHCEGVRVLGTYPT
ncbi:prephenate dehydratase [Svornostia abyssi]|uniref:Prephenate dehydratase n=1 Tax=Svornostia abyssi TaxID=2898438 RepID=A0ABY5PJ97_9ACTN|nr:prephenate dehydratase [Parviterribacteraceae bacterium J379]